MRPFRRALLAVLTLASLAGGLALAPVAEADPAAGTLVPTFGTDGTTTVDLGARDSAGYDVVVDALGRTLVLDLYQDTSYGVYERRGQVTVTRFLATGHRDPTFGTDGSVRFDEPTTWYGGGLAVDPSGRVVVAVEHPLPSAYREGVTVRRLLPSGQLDVSFGTAGTADVSVPVAGTTTDFLLALGAPSNDRVVVVSSSATLALDGSGALVPGYGVAGAVSLPAHQAHLAAAVRSDGSVVALTARPDPQDAPYGVLSELRALTPGGAPDPGFGAAGTVPVGGPLSNPSMDADRSGRVALEAGDQVWRYLADGSPDPALGGAAGLEVCPDAHDGVRSGTDVSAADDAVALVDADQGIVTRFAPTLGGEIWGRSCATPFDDRELERSPQVVAVEGLGPGAVVLAGSRQEVPFGIRSLAVAVLTADLRPVPTFGTGGVAWTLVGDRGWDLPTEAGEDASGRLLVAGRAAGALFVVRLRADGTLDESYGDGGKVVVPDLGVAVELVVRADGSATVLARSRSGSALLRLRADGRPDARFGVGGRVDPLPFDLYTGGGTRLHTSDLAEGSGVLVVGGRAGAGSDFSDHARLAAYDATTGAPLPLFGGTTVDLAGTSSVPYVAVVGGRVLAFTSATTDKWWINQKMSCFLVVGGLPCPDVGAGTGVRYLEEYVQEPVVSGLRLAFLHHGGVLWRDLSGNAVAQTTPRDDPDHSFTPWYDRLSVGADGTATVVRSGDAPGPITIHRYLADATRDAAFGDDGQLPFQMDQVRDEPTLSVTRRDGTVALIGGGPDVVVQLLDVSARRPFPSLTIDDATGSEGGSLSFTVHLDPPTRHPYGVRAQVTVAEGTADDDDLAAPGLGLHEVWFAPGQTEATVTLALEADGAPEPAETLLATVEGYPARVDRGSAVGTIRNVADNPGPTPHTVRRPSASGDGKGVVVGWRAPRSAGAEPVAGYLVLLTRGNEVLGASVVSSDVLRTSVDSAPSSSPVAVTIFAFNSYGFGPARSAGQVVPSTWGAGLPGAPRDVRAAPGRSSVRVTWAPPESDGGTPLTRYVISVADSRGVPLTSREVGPDVRQATVTGLPNGGTYQVRVSARSSAGASGSTDPVTVPASSSAPAPTAPDEVSYVVATQTGSRPVAGVVAWGAPADDGGARLTGYTVAAVRDGTVVAWRDVGPDERSVTLAGLPAGAQVDLVVVAWNKEGGSVRVAPTPWR